MKRFEWLMLILAGLGLISVVTLLVGISSWIVPDPVPSVSEIAITKLIVLAVVLLAVLALLGWLGYLYAQMARQEGEWKHEKAMEEKAYKEREALRNQTSYPTPLDQWQLAKESLTAIYKLRQDERLSKANYEELLTKLSEELKRELPVENTTPTTSTEPKKEPKNAK